MKKIVLLFLIIMNSTLLFTFRGNPQQLPETSAEVSASSSAAAAPVRVFLPAIYKGKAMYVSPNGSDANPGTSDKPWKTITKAANMAVPGDTIYIRGGTYSGSAHFVTSGTAANPIQIMAYPGEHPIIDGTNSGLGSGSALLWIEGNYIVASGLEVRNAPYYGIIVLGNYDTVADMYVHHSYSIGILINRGQHSTVSNSRVWWNSTMNENGKSSSYASGISAARAGVAYATIRHNTVWENWGEGISTFEADHTVIEDNTVHDSFSSNIYISDATNILCQRNFVYMDPASPLSHYGDRVGIMMGDETYNPPSANITIINNIAYGNHNNFMWWRGNQGGGMNSVLIADNTFVNGTGDANHGEGGVTIGLGMHQNSRFINNLVLQDGSLPVIATVSQPGITYAHNLWSKTPYSYASSSTDIIGDPKLAQTGGNLFVPGWYQLSAGSPAVNKAQALPDVSVDYFSRPRGGSPDIGAAEYIP